MLVFRTTDMTKWGAGKGGVLTKEDLDLNFWELVERIVALEDGDGAEPLGIDHFSVVGSALTVHMSDLTTRGPYILPVAKWNFREDGWLPATAYAAQDVFVRAGSVYLVTWPHISAATFDPGANDGAGHDYYSLMLSAPEVYRTLAFFFPAVPVANELIFSYEFAETLTFLDGLALSRASSEVAPDAAASYPIYKNATAIGSADWADGATAATFTFNDAVTFVPGDILRVRAPALPDPIHQGLRMTFRVAV